VGGGHCAELAGFHGNARSVTEVGEHMAAIKDDYGLVCSEITKEVERLEPKRLRAAPGLETPAHLV